MVSLPDVLLELPDPSAPVEDDTRPPGEGGLAGRILTAAYLGDHIEYEIETAIGRLFAIATDSDRPLPQGSAVALDFGPRGLALID